MPTSRTRLIPRAMHVRDARLFVIATEGKQTERQYFEGFNSPRVHVEVLAPDDSGLSAPNWLLERLDEFNRQYDLNDDDERWLVLDVDRRLPEQLDSWCRQAVQKGYRLGVSNPCFELWLYLHFSEPDFDNPEFEALVEQERGNRSAAMEARLRQRLADQGGYNKSRIVFERFLPGIPDAIARARALDENPNDRWPRKFPGTRAYPLVEKLYQYLPPDCR
jgi:hypothetical protein